MVVHSGTSMYLSLCASLCAMEQDNSREVESWTFLPRERVRERGGGGAGVTTYTFEDRPRNALMSTRQTHGMNRALFKTEDKAEEC